MHVLLVAVAAGASWLRSDFERGSALLAQAKAAPRSAAGGASAARLLDEAAEIFEAAAARYNASFVEKKKRKRKRKAPPRSWTPMAAQHLFFAGIARFRAAANVPSGAHAQRLRSALANFLGVVRVADAATMKDAVAAALEWSARCYSALQRDCDAHDQYEVLLRLRHGSIAMLQPPSRLLHAAAATNCDAARAHTLWKILLDMGELDAAVDATKCKTCWNKMDIARRLAAERAERSPSRARRRGGPSARTRPPRALEWRWAAAAESSGAEAFFRAKLAPHTPWRHAAQTPAEFDATLATAQPTPWHDAAALAPCGALREHSEAIRAEYRAWERRPGQAFPGERGFDAAHDDAALVAKQARAWGGETAAPWQYLHLRRVDAVGAGRSRDGRAAGSGAKAAGWDDALCSAHFPTTCAALREVRGVRSAPPRPCERGWCRDNAHRAAPPGLVAFYRLAPGAEVPLHSGPTNRRLKCQLVVRADDSADEDVGAWIEVAGVARRQRTGDVLAFDDSYLHRVAVGEAASASRIVLDVAFWHPALFVAHSRDEL